MVKNLITNRQTQKKIPVKMKHFMNKESMRRNLSFICAKFIHMKKEDAKFLRWWIKFNRKSGYEKIHKCKLIFKILTN
jgi:hypothetical protein